MANTAPHHIDAWDLVRILTVLGVISVHATWFVNGPNSVWANGVLDALHYTREVFLFLTAFVLFYTYYRRPLNLRTFWKKRFGLIGIPYVIWSAFYLLYGGAWTLGVLGYLRTLGVDLAAGTAWFHLYYLLVTMQIYLAFPLMIWIIRKTEGYHGWLLLFAFLVELALMTGFQYYLAPLSSWLPLPMSWLLSYRGQFFLTYEFYLVAGALMGVHYPAIHEWIVTRGRRLTMGLGLSLAALWTLYAVLVLNHVDTPVVAASVLQPLMVPFCAFVIVGLYALGVRWAQTKEATPRLSAFIVLGADLSFGLYLIHPFFLQEITTYVVPLAGHLSGLVVTPVVVALTFLASFIAVRLIAATKASRYVIGRDPIPLAASTVILFQSALRGVLMLSRRRPTPAFEGGPHES